MPRHPVAILFALLLTACASREQLELSGPTMGTTYSVKVANAPKRIDVHSVQIVIDQVLDTIDRQMSTYRADSEISRFNAAQSTEWISVSPELAQLVANSLQVSAESQGALDITVAPLVNLWGMGPEGARGELPSQAQIEAARANVGFQNVSVREQPAALRKQLPALTIDLNAVAPGFAVDLLAA